MSNPERKSINTVGFKMGGDFAVTAEHLASPANINFEFPLTKKHALWADTGRSAVFAALQDLQKRTGVKQAILPFYSCFTMIMPFRQLGFDITFYSMGSDLNTPSGLPESADNSVLLFAHYFGKRNHPLIKYVEEQRNNTHSSFKVIEDCVQTCASSAYGKHGDYIVHSLRKFLPVPDGGIIESDEPIPSPLLPPDESFISEKILSKLVRGVNGEAEEFLDLYSHSEMKIVNEITPRECSHLTRLLLQKLDFEEAGKHRIRFWHLLAKALKQVSIVTPLFSRLGEDETPLLFPVLVKKKLRDPLRSFLAQHSLYCPVHWVLSETSLHSQFPVDCDLSQSLLSIPIDQRVSEETLQKLVTTLNAFDPEAL